jgi:ergothioneine biosynthesis protein EgtB
VQARTATAELHPEALLERYREVRAFTAQLAAPLSPEDAVVQSMPDTSPAKWHLAHTTWFFETFVLKPRYPEYREFRPDFGFLFNSYYHTVGAMHPRPQRGLLTRPDVQEVLDYRGYVDIRMSEALEHQDFSGDEIALVELGLNHEQQHQELMLTDIKHLFSCSPLWPAYCEMPLDATSPEPLEWIEGPVGRIDIGAGADGFAFDNERPRHSVWLRPFVIASRPVSNAEYCEFIRDGGYTRPELWLSDGWSTVQQERWAHPLYWAGDLASEFTLAGRQKLDPHAPATHLCFYEADAYARWAGARLPTEAEWETVAAQRRITGNFVETNRLHPGGPVTDAGRWFGDVWEWTASAYAPYPGYVPPPGAIGEYNGKFMCNQLVLRGGSCVSAQPHLRASYRNFFYPQARWQFSGLRLARDA